MLVIEKPHSNPIDMKGGCVCPACLLSPDQVSHDEHWPIDYGPDLILCPRCGLVPVRAVRRTPEEAAEILGTREARSAFHDSTRRRGRGSGDPVGEAKDLSGRRFKDLRLEQGFVGFPEAEKHSRPRAVDPLEQGVSPSITKEISAWLEAMAAKARGTDSDVARACLSWAFQFRPALVDGLESAHKQRRRLPVRLTARDKVALDSLASECGMNPTRYTLCLLERMRRKTSLAKQLTF